MILTQMVKVNLESLVHPKTNRSMIKQKHSQNKCIVFIEQIEKGLTTKNGSNRVVLLLHRISNDCRLPGPSSLGLRPTLMFVVVGRVTDRVLKGKPAQAFALAQRHSGAGRGIQVGLVENSHRKV